jgi:hypothetical protein
VQEEQIIESRVSVAELFRRIEAIPCRGEDVLQGQRNYS